MLLSLAAAATAALEPKPIDRLPLVEDLLEAGSCCDDSVDWVVCAPSAGVISHFERRFFLGGSPSLQVEEMWGVL